METPNAGNDDGAFGRPAHGPVDGSQAHLVRTPEEVARAFLEEGGEVVPGPDLDTRFHWRWSVAVGVTAAVVALAALAAFALITTGHTNSPSASGAAAGQAAATTPAADHHAAAATSTTTSTTTPAPANSAVSVDVLNASPSNGVAALTAAALRQDGFNVTAVGNAPNKIAAGAPSQILYGPSGLTAAHTLAAALAGPVTLVPTPAVTDASLTLLVASPQLTVIPQTTTTTTSATPKITTGTTTPASASV